MKVDGPTKEEFVWGFRSGMLTFSTRAFLSEETLYKALERKCAGAIRSAISNCSHVAQSVLAKALPQEAITAERRREAPRAGGPGEEGPGDPQQARLRRPLGALSLQRRLLHVLHLKGLDAETYRRHLLDKYAVGVIADGERDVRIAFSSVDEKDLGRPLQHPRRRRPRPAPRRPRHGLSVSRRAAIGLSIPARLIPGGTGVPPLISIGTGVPPVISGGTGVPPVCPGDL